jgi:hypothetical protein
MTPEDESFTANQIWGGLFPEFASTKYVLATGLRLLRSGGPFERDKDAVFATLAVGVEKLAKLAHGLLSLDEGQPWPKMNVTRDGWGHACARMDKRLRARISARLELEEFADKVYVRQLLCTVEHDQVWAQVVEALEAYGTEGRFYALDVIAGNGREEMNPLPHWEAAENTAVELDSELASLMHTDANQFDAALSEAIAKSVHRWWALVTLSGVHGMYGEGWGKTFGADLLPDGLGRIVIDPGCLD